MDQSLHIVEPSDYARAEKFLPQNIHKRVYRSSVSPHWIDGEDSFWYRVNTMGGKRFFKVDPGKRSREEAFDHVKLAAALSTASGTPYESHKLPFEEFEYVNEGGAIEFSVNDVRWRCDLDSYECTEIGSRRGGELLSPDGRWAAFCRDHDLWVRDTESDEEVRLTTDGEEDYSYATRPGCRLSTVTEKLTGKKTPPALKWSADSRRILTHRLDQRNVEEICLLQSVPADGVRPVPHFYRYPLPGDEEVPVAHMMVIDVEDRQITPLDGPPVLSLVRPLTDGGLAGWTTGQDHVWIVRPERGFSRATLEVFDPGTGQRRILVEEELESGNALPCFSMSDSPSVWVMDSGNEAVWFSMRDGWAHLYLYREGGVVRQITAGDYAVREIKWVDEDERAVYFTGCGREPERDPYYTHLYRAGLDDGDVQLLSPEDAFHRITASPSGDFFIDTYSRVDSASFTVVRDATGNVVMELELAELDELRQLGWQPPERFCVKARDGVTDIYGLIYKPTTFDPEKKYPVIDAIYPGPQVIRTPKAFPADPKEVHRFWDPQSVAELGFIVITIDGMGTPYRSRAFLEVACGRDFGEAGGLLDHVVGIRQLADRHTYMDIDRVGIYGHSGGGYASTRAMLKFPDFFKVAVSSAGNHDQLGYQAMWGEFWIGLHEGDNYGAQSNIDLAENLSGKLLLVHGDMDDNVHPALTMQMAYALIEADKDFDMLVLPGRNHLFTDLTHGDQGGPEIRFDPYFTRKMWDYFVQHLHGVVPPRYSLDNDESGEDR